MRIMAADTFALLHRLMNSHSKREDVAGPAQVAVIAGGIELMRFGVNQNMAHLPAGHRADR